MNRIDFTPLYRNTIGFDRLANLIDATMRNETQTSGGYPPYNIEATGENRYSITLAVAGFAEPDFDIQVEKGILTVRGNKNTDESAEKRNYLYQGIATRAFERKFNLADYVEVTSAELNNGLLTINLFKDVPDAMKPRKITIGSGTQADNVIEHKIGDAEAAA